MSQESRDAMRFRWIERHRPLIEYKHHIHGQELPCGWIVALEYGAEIGTTLRAAIDNAMRKIPLDDSQIMEAQSANDKERQATNESRGERLQQSKEEI